MLVSILLPTRKRVDRLIKSVNSFYATARIKDRFDIHLKIDDDDDETQSVEFNGPKVIKHVSPRGNGWKDFNLWIGDMASQADGEWVWMWNDDCIIETENWDDMLKEVPTHGYIVQPRTHRLGHSCYVNHEGGPFPVVPNQCWKYFGAEKFPDPPDTGIDNLLRLENGWKTWFIDVAFHHDRDDDTQLEKHRKQ